MKHENRTFSPKGRTIPKAMACFLTPPHRLLQKDWGGNGVSEVQTIQLPAAGSVTSQTASNGWRSLLESNVGRRVAAEFLIGQDGMAEKTGEIYAVQSDYFLLKDDNGNYVACDLFSLKFVTFCPGCGTGSGTQTQSETAENGAAAMTVTPLRTAAPAAALNYAKRKARR